jgi:hypothetical protein
MLVWTGQRDPGGELGAMGTTQAIDLMDSDSEGAVLKRSNENLSS